MLTLSSTKPLTVSVVLPSNVIRIESQADLYTAGVRLLRFVEVQDEQEAVTEAQGMKAYLLKSKIKPWFYLIFPVVEVTS